MNGNHTEEEKRNKKNKTKTKRNENEKLEEISECGLSKQHSNRFFSSDSIFEPREAGAGDMSATDREIEQFKQFCLDSKYVSGIKMLSMTKQDDQVFYILDVLLRIASPFLAGLPRTVPRCLSMCATSPSRRKPDLELVFFSSSLTML